MAKAPAYTATGTKAAEGVSLPKSIFEVEVKNHELLGQAVRRHLAAARNAHAKTKLRGEVRGGGRKPWKQKGTGNARAGSRRSPLWTGGGITFGPTGKENYEVKLPKKAKQLALRQALSLQSEIVKVVADINFKDGKTKEAATLLKKLGASRNTIVIVEAKDESTARALRNLPGVSLKSANFLHAYEVLTADHLIFTKAGLAAVEARFKAKSANPMAAKGAK